MNLEFHETNVRNSRTEYSIRESQLAPTKHHVASRSPLLIHSHNKPQAETSPPPIATFADGRNRPFVEPHDFSQNPQQLHPPSSSQGTRQLSILQPFQNAQPAVPSIGKIPFQPSIQLPCGKPSFPFRGERPIRHSLFS